MASLKELGRNLKAAHDAIARNDSPELRAELQAASVAFHQKWADRNGMECALKVSA